MDKRSSKPTKQLYRWTRENGHFGLRHTAIVEKVLGRKLKGLEEIHHVDGDGTNNNKANLVVCPDRIYHSLLHLRQRALEKCGNASYRKCPFCKEWDDPSNMVAFPKNPKTSKKRLNQFKHRHCENSYAVRKRALKRLLHE